MCNNGRLRKHDWEQNYLYYTHERDLIRIFDCWWALFGNRAAENNNEGDSVYAQSDGGLYSVTALRKINDEGDSVY